MYLKWNARYIPVFYRLSNGHWSNFVVLRRCPRKLLTTFMEQDQISFSSQFNLYSSINAPFRCPTNNIHHAIWASEILENLSFKYRYLPPRLTICLKYFLIRTSFACSSAEVHTQVSPMVETKHSLVQE